MTRAWAALLLLSAPAQTTRPDPALLLSRASESVGAMLSRLPDYTCLMTVERSMRFPKDVRFYLQNRARVEVAFLGGRELYAWPGSAAFEQRDLASMLGPGGAIGAGDFALHLRETYLRDRPLEFVRFEKQAGRDSFRLSQSVPRAQSSYRLSVPRAGGPVGYRITAWHESASAGLLRFEFLSTDVPPEPQINRAFKSIDYANVAVGSSSFLLPARTELSLAYASGNEELTTTTFTRCRQYSGESTLSFDDPPAAASSPSPAKQRNAVLPPGLHVTTRLDEPLDLELAAMGDPVLLTATSGSPNLPPGARILARIREVRCDPNARSGCTLTLAAESFDAPTAAGPFHATLLSYDGNKPNPQLPNRLRPHLTTKLPRGYTLVWKTLAPVQE